MKHPRKSSGIFASNGLIREGDRVSYDDGYVAFTATIECKDNEFGVTLEDSFIPLHSFALDCDDMDFGLDFQIIGTLGNPLFPLDLWIEKAKKKEPL